MTPRLPILAGLTFLLAACGGPDEKIADTSSEADAQVTKSTRRAPAEVSISSRDRLRNFLTEKNDPSNDPQEVRDVAQLIWDVVDTEPDLVREALAKLPIDHVERARLIAHVAMRLAEQDADVALAWAENLPGEYEKSMAIGRIATVIATEDPERAAELASAEMPPGQEQDGAVVNIISRWAGANPEDAAGWLVLFEATRARAAGLDALADQWVRKSIPDVVAWVGGLEEGALRQDAAKSLANAINKRPPEERDEAMTAAPEWLKAELEAHAAQASSTSQAIPVSPETIRK